MENNPNHKNGYTHADQLRLEFERQNMLFDAQLPIIQRFLEAQAQQVAEAYSSRLNRVRFSLPDRVVETKDSKPLEIIQALREQHVGSLADRLAHRDVHTTVRQRLTELEQSNDKGVVIAAGLIRFASATHMVRYMLPSGRIVTYKANDEDDIPSLPVDDGSEPESAITASTDAIVEEGTKIRFEAAFKYPLFLLRDDFTCLNGWLLARRVRCWSTQSKKLKPT